MSIKIREKGTFLLLKREYDDLGHVYSFLFFLFFSKSNQYIYIYIYIYNIYCKILWLSLQGKKNKFGLWSNRILPWSRTIHIPFPFFFSLAKSQVNLLKKKVENKVWLWSLWRTVITKLLFEKKNILLFQNYIWTRIEFFNKYIIF